MENQRQMKTTYVLHACKLTCTVWSVQPTHSTPSLEYITALNSNVIYENLAISRSRSNLVHGVGLLPHQTEKDRKQKHRSRKNVHNSSFPPAFSTLYTLSYIYIVPRECYIMGSIESKNAGEKLEYMYSYSWTYPQSSVFHKILIRYVINCLLDVKMSLRHGQGLTSIECYGLMPETCFIWTVLVAYEMKNLCSRPAALLIN